MKADHSTAVLNWRTICHVECSVSSIEDSSLVILSYNPPHLMGISHSSYAVSFRLVIFEDCMLKSVRGNWRIKIKSSCVERSDSCVLSQHMNFRGKVGVGMMGDVGYGE